MSQVPPFMENDAKKTPNTIQQWQRQIRDDEVDFLTKAVGGNSNVTLTTSESHTHVIEFTGVLTGNINVIYSLIKYKFAVANKTSGAFTLTVKTASGAGVTVGQGKRCMLYCDGTDVVRLTPDT